jgi:hypothetical protein
VGLRGHGEAAAARELPNECPYTLDELLDHGWYPANRAGLTDEA